MKQLSIKKQDSIAQKKAENTLLEHIECIVELVENSNLNKEFYKKAKKNINYVSKKMELTPNQAVIFAIFIENSADCRIRISDFAKTIGCRLTRILSLSDDINELEKRHLVRCSTRLGEGTSYRVPMEVLSALKKNEPYIPVNTENLAIEKLFTYIKQLFDERDDDEITTENLYVELHNLLESSPKLKFCELILDMEDLMSGYDDFILLLCMCQQFVMENSKRFSINEIDGLFDKEWEGILLKRRIQNCELDLLASGIIEYCNDNGFENTSCLQFTDRSVEVLFAELEIATPKSIIGKDIIQHTNIKTKELFYNEKEEKSINQLTNLFNKKNLFAVLKNLENNGMRKGIICLFHGGPGTGKTETVYQLARKTERNIMLVDISESKSKWYGETEKKIKAIFDSYRAYIKEHREAPILLFNEADAIIGKRKDNSKDAVDRTENTVQNIILQEMETFEGIMIATTNLTQNIDKAFERRFLYKIEFDKPNVSVKERIWKTMLPILKKNERHELAQLYSFSGGEIENVVRKCTVENILNNKEVSFNSIREYCDSELLYKKVEMKKIGFR